MRNKKLIFSVIIFAAVVAMAVLIFACIRRGSVTPWTQGGNASNAASSMDDSNRETAVEPEDEETPEDGDMIENAGGIANSSAAESGPSRSGEESMPNGSTAQNNQGLTLGGSNDTEPVVDFSDLTESETETPEQIGSGLNSQNQNGQEESGQDKNENGTNGNTQEGASDPTEDQWGPLYSSEGEVDN